MVSKVNARPMPNNPIPEKITRIARYIEQNAENRLSLEDLSKQFEISTSHLQKSFKQAIGISPKQFQEACRQGKFKSLLKEGMNISDAIYEAGYGSSSRVYENTKLKLGMSPKTYRQGGKGERLHYAYGKTKLGLLLMACSTTGICFVQFGESRDKLLGELQEEFPNAELCASKNQNSPELQHWIRALELFLNQKGPLPELPLDLRGTAFQLLVWRFLTTIPEGETISYQTLAQAIGKPKASRAVGSACGANKIGILIPCHRVLRGDGALGGYRWGLDKKAALLEIERSSKVADCHSE